LARRSCQTALYHIAEAMTRWRAPVLSFTMEEVWEYLPGARPMSVLMATWYDIRGSAKDVTDVDWETVLHVRQVVSRMLEKLRKEGVTGSSLHADVTMSAEDELSGKLDAIGEEQLFALISSYAELKPASERPADAFTY